MERHLVIGEDSVYEIDDTCMQKKYGDRGSDEETKRSGPINVNDRREQGGYYSGKDLRTKKQKI